MAQLQVFAWPRGRSLAVSCLVIAIAAVLVLRSHWDQLWSAVPYLILLACPLLHVFGHGKHSHAAADAHSAHKRTPEQ